MTRVLLIHCDKCDTPIDEKDVVGVQLRDFDERTIDMFDLCKKCQKRLDEFRKYRPC